MGCVLCVDLQYFNFEILWIKYFDFVWLVRSYRKFWLNFYIRYFLDESICINIYFLKFGIFNSRNDVNGKFWTENDRMLKLNNF